MKINRIALTIALGGTILPWELAVAADRLPLPKPLTSTGRIVDAPQSIENSATNAQRPVLSMDRRPEVFRQNAIAVDEASLPSVAPSDLEQQTSKPGFHTTGYSTSVQASSDSIIAPTPDPYVSGQVATPMAGSGNCSTGSCGSGSCGSGGCSSDGCSGGSCGGSSYSSGPSYQGFLGGYCADNCNIGCGRRKLGWLKADAILWWGPELDIPNLVVRGPRSQPTVFNEVVIGGNTPLQSEMIPGMKMDFGFWLDDCESVGVGGRAFGLFTDPSSQTVSSSGEALGIPFYDVNLPGFSAYLIAADFGVDGVNTGSITVANDLDFVSADAYGSLLMVRSGKARADIIGGYTFARLDTSLGLEAITVNGAADLTPNDTITTSTDSFSTANTFHGGHVGFKTEISRGRLGFSTLGKVSIGNVEQRVRISGRTTDVLNGVVTSSGNFGTFAYPSNTIDATRDLPSFLPEAAVGLRYSLKPNIAVNVGYTFLFLPDVVLATNMIDQSVDLIGVPAATPPIPPQRPAPKIDNVSYYLHGIDVGLSINF
jgi:hypothetical protein